MVKQRSRVWVIVALSLVVFACGHRIGGSSQMSYLQQLALETVGPVLRFAHSLSETVSNFLKNYVFLLQVQRENRELQAQLLVLRKKLTDYQEAFLENQRLRRLLDFKDALDTESIAAEVVAHNPLGWFQTIVVDKGSTDGIKPDMVVVSPDGVVGRVLNTSKHFSQVVLITDPGSSVDALIQRNRSRGILSGQGRNSCCLEYVRKNLEVRIGDLIITSGKDGIFPKGLRLAIVTQIIKDPVDLFQKIEAKPVVNLADLEEVLIFQGSNLSNKQWQTSTSLDNFSHLAPNQVGIEPS